MIALPRLALLDIAKGIGIILVVVGHVLLRSDAPGASETADLIYLFHMPMFFLLAGMTLRPEPLGKFALRKLMRLGLPYAFFLVLLGLPALAVSCGLETSVPDFGIDRCDVMAFKLVFGGSLLGGIFGTFWFIPCLLLALILAQIILRAPPLSRQTTIILACALLIGAYGLPMLLPASTALLGIGVVPMAATFVLIGHLARKELASATGLVLTISIMLATISIFLATHFDMKAGIYGIPVWSLAAAVALATLLLRLSKLVEGLLAIASRLQIIGQKTSHHPLPPPGGAPRTAPSRRASRRAPDHNSVGCPAPAPPPH